MAYGDHWDRFFLRQALSWTRQSKDPDTQVGSVIVAPDHTIRATGFNGLPRRLTDTPERLQNRVLKLQLMVHAERNAICAAAKNGISLDGCTLYLAATDDTGLVWGGPPCTACTIELMQAGIVKIVAYPLKAVSKWRSDLLFARSLLEEAGIVYEEMQVTDE